MAAIEVDPELTEYLRTRYPRLELIEANALDADWTQWGPGVLAGNLPYYIATPLISRYLRQPGLLSQAVFLVQKEVAERITARPGTRDYGYFSVECQFLARTEYLFTVAPGAFRPPPKVDSAAIRSPRCGYGARPLPGVPRLRFDMLPPETQDPAEQSARLFDPAPDISRRAEELSVDEFVALHRLLTGSQKDQSRLV